MADRSVSLRITADGKVAVEAIRKVAASIDGRGKAGPKVAAKSRRALTARPPARAD